MSRRGVALVLALASACTTPAAPPVPPATTPPAASLPLPRAGNGESARSPVTGAEQGAEPTHRAAAPVAPVPAPVPSFGGGDARPSGVHAFRFAVAVRAMRANRSGTQILALLSLLPAVVEGKTRTAVDPFADGEWFLVYGPDVALPGANANVVRHVRPNAEVAKTIADAGFEPSDAGPPGSVRAELFGVRDVLLRPQSGTLALVPADRAADLGAALAKPIDPGVKNGELARAFLGSPAKHVHGLPAEITNANVIVKASADGGLDVAADAECGGAASCAATATLLADLVVRQNSMVIRFATRGVLSGLAFRADGERLRATLHASPEQVDAIVGLARAALDLPAATSAPSK